MVHILFMVQTVVPIFVNYIPSIGFVLYIHGTKFKPFKIKTLTINLPKMFIVTKQNQ